MDEVLRGIRCGRKMSDLNGSNFARQPSANHYPNHHRDSSAKSCSLIFLKFLSLTTGQVLVLMWIERRCVIPDNSYSGLVWLMTSAPSVSCLPALREFSILMRNIDMLFFFTQLLENNGIQHTDHWATASPIESLKGWEIAARGAITSEPLQWLEFQKRDRWLLFVCFVYM